MKFKKKYVISAALLLALGAAVYVNWQFTSVSPVSKELGAASYVNATAPAATKDETVQTSALSKEQMNFFASERTKRQNAQDKVIDNAREILDVENVSEDEMTQAQKDVAELLRRFTVQDSIETIVKAKGFSECVCCISDEGVTVIVPDEELNDTASMVIGDAVTSHYDVSYENISIVGA